MRFLWWKKRKVIKIDLWVFKSGLFQYYCLKNKETDYSVSAFEMRYYEEMRQKLYIGVHLNVRNNIRDALT